MDSKYERNFTYVFNGISLNMIFIPAGKFIMGASDSEPGSWNTERPQHEVRVSSFYMGRYPITQAQWRVIADLEPIGKELELEPSYFKGDNRPVEQVSWQDAIEFCARLSRQTGRNYRLPSEAEWEYACRAGTTTPFHFGETISTDIANYDGSSVYGRSEKGENREKTTDVDFFKVVNAFGLSGMHGNVWEWCLDPWHDNYEGAPTDGRVWSKRKKYNGVYTMRGGSWFEIPRCCCSARRSFSKFPLRDIGFRVVCDIPTV